MTIWGTVIGGVTGLALGGPLGALMGGVAGHAFDRMRQGGAFATLEKGPEGFTRWRTPEEEARTRAAETVASRQVLFTTAIVVLAAKMAKSDGVVSRDEIAAFKRLFRIPANEAEGIGRLFNDAKRDSRGFEPYAEQIAHMFVDQPKMLEEILGVLFQIGLADGAVLHAGEVNFLGRVASIFGFTPTEFDRIRASFTGPGDKDAYGVLGLSRHASNEEIKVTYRRLLRENHPDLLMSQGLPEEFIEVANKKMAAINSAYDFIAKERGLR